MDMTLDEFKYLTSTCLNEQYQPLTIDKAKDKYCDHYRLGLNSIFVPDSSRFSNQKTEFVFYCNRTRFKKSTQTS